MTVSKLIELANSSGGTLYLMCLLLLAALTVIIERTLFLKRMEQGGDELMALLPRFCKPRRLSLSHRRVKPVPGTWKRR
jgi:hypothetical protein